MRKPTAVLFFALAAFALSAGPAGAKPPPPHCDPMACPDPVEIAGRAVCNVGYKLGFHCV